MASSQHVETAAPTFCTISRAGLTCPGKTAPLRMLGFGRVDLPKETGPTLLQKNGCFIAWRTDFGNPTVFRSVLMHDRTRMQQYDRLFDGE